MKVSKEFSKNALSYEANNSIQNSVVKKLLSHIKTQPQNILDLGCGSGAVCKSIEWDYNHFTGVDFAKGMLELHPKAKNIESIYGNFNDKEFFNTLFCTANYDYIISASALQWADDLESVFKNIKKLNAPIALAIFTSNTFKTLNDTAGLDSILRGAKEVEKLQKKYFNAESEVVNYKLEFHSTRDIFKYIKQSGVSGSRTILNFAQTKKLMNEYPLSYLEFEVIYIFKN
ncbi:MAG: methyltransferase domain-containing protein [Campylobacterota bacterium]|nr:methyltransferase domain-containing protein [Campylobacterota bacterium]